MPGMRPMIVRQLADGADAASSVPSARASSSAAPINVRRLGSVASMTATNAKEAALSMNATTRPPTAITIPAIAGPTK